MSRSGWNLITLLGFAALLLCECAVAQDEEAPIVGGNDATLVSSPTPSSTPSQTTASAPVASPTLYSSPTPSAAAPPTDPTATRMPVTPPTVGGPGAATDLQAEASCSDAEPRQSIVKLSWKVASPPGSEQRVAMTTYLRGFEEGVFVTSEPLPPDQSFSILEQTSPGIIHYWWVLTLRADGWTSSEMASFEGPTCVADFQP